MGARSQQYDGVRVRIYAFETGGNGTYDGQAGIVGNRKDARPISPAMGYNQLLSTNTVSLLAEHGDKFVAALEKSAAALSETDRKAMERKIATLKKMIAFGLEICTAKPSRNAAPSAPPGAAPRAASVWSPASCAAPQSALSPSQPT